MAEEIVELEIQNREVRKVLFRAKYQFFGKSKGNFR